MMDEKSDDLRGDCLLRLLRYGMLILVLRCVNFLCNQPPRIVYVE